MGCWPEYTKTRAARSVCRQGRSGAGCSRYSIDDSRRRTGAEKVEQMGNLYLIQNPEMCFPRDPEDRESDTDDRESEPDWYTCADLNEGGYDGEDEEPETDEN